MKLLYKYVFILFLFLFLECSPPRARRYGSNKIQSHRIVKAKPTKKRFDNSKKNVIDKNITPANSTLAKKRFGDTIYIDLNQINMISKAGSEEENHTDKEINKTKAEVLSKKKINNIGKTVQSDKKAIQEYKRAIELFNQDKFSESCPIIEHLASTFSDDDTLKYDAMFYWSECLIQKNKLQKSLEILLSLINNKKSTQSVIEKSLVRIGHIYCLENDKIRAKIYFDRLRQEFPQSPFINLANCSVVNN